MQNDYDAQINEDKATKSQTSKLLERVACGVLILALIVSSLWLLGSKMSKDEKIAELTSTLAAREKDLAQVNDALGEMSALLPRAESTGTPVSSAAPDAAPVVSEAMVAPEEIASVLAAANRLIEEQQARIFRLEDELSAKTPPGGPGTDKIAYLTFDDGPSPVTEDVLRVLEKEGIKATFFVVHGKYDHLLKDIHEAGHAIGVHSYTHSYKTIYASETAFWNDFDLERNIVEAATGMPVRIFRFPGGGSNTVSRKYSQGIMSRLAKQAEEKGYAYFDWNVDSGDASGNNVPADRLVRNVKSTVGNKPRINVLMHDSGAKQTTAKALPEIIAALREKGYAFAALSADAPAFHQTVVN